MTVSVNAPLGIAPLKNVLLLTDLLERMRTRTHGLPGLGVFFGPSGFGKTQACIFAANVSRAYYVEVKESWTRKHLYLSILKEMGIRPDKTVPVMAEQIGEQLALSGRPLIIDEADVLVKKNLVEAAREIILNSDGMVILVGEEALPQKLQKWERVHSRVFDHVGLQPASRKDAEALAAIYAPQIVIADDLMGEVLAAAAGSIRRVCFNLDKVRERAVMADMTALDLAQFRQMGGDFPTGKPPARRVF